MKLGNTKIITIAQDKGGVGKSTVSISLGYALSRLGYNILVIDTDAQGNATDNFLTLDYDGNGSNITLEQLRDDGRTLYDCLTNPDEPIENFISKTIYENISIMASDARLRKCISMLETAWGDCEYPYRKIFSDLKMLNEYDIVFVDSRPSIELENRQIMVATDYILIPSTTNIRSTDGIMRVINAVEQVNDNIKGSDAQILGVLLNQINMRTAVAKQVVPELYDNPVYGKYVFKTLIPIDENVNQSAQVAVPLGAYDPKSRAAAAFDLAAKEVLAKI